MNRFIFSFILILGMLCPLHAFPPAPFYTLYGTIRDQVGQRVADEGAVVILERGGVELGRTPINSTTRLDQNYELQIRIDQNRAGTTIYSKDAVKALGLFNLVVEINGIAYYPISASDTLQAGNGGERIRLDLNISDDGDGDGLPDLWEQWQLYQAGYTQDQNGNWEINRITRDGDLDGDGTSNYQEYLAGTFAGDASEKFSLEIKEKRPAHARFEFYAIIGKTYTIEGSSDMKSWTKLPFSIGVLGVGDVSFVAPEVAVTSAFTATAAVENQKFYRLTVR